MVDDGLRKDELCWLKGDLSSSGYFSRLRRAYPTHPLAGLAELDERAIRAGAGLYHVASSFMHIRETIAFHLDGEFANTFSVHFRGTLHGSPSIGCTLDYLSSTSLTLGIHYSPLEERDCQAILDGVTKTFTSHAPLPMRATLTRSHVHEDILRDLYQVYLLKGRSLVERLESFERGLPQEPEPPVPLIRRLVQILYRRAA